MQEKKQIKILRRPGRPKKSTLPPREQARIRKKRYRAKLAKDALSKVEILIPTTLKNAVKNASGTKSLSKIGEEAFRTWLECKNR
jgi:hypothetical protein